MSLDASLVQDNDDDDDEDVQADSQHIHPQATGCIQARHCREILGLPTRVSHLTTEFTKLLSEAYGDHYGQPNIIKFSRGSFRWCKKLSFLDPTSQRRQIFKIGDFTIGKNGNEVVRIDHIFIHNWDGSRRLLCVKGTCLTAQSLQTSVDPVLGLGYRRLRLQHKTSASPAIVNASTVLIGLPSIRPRQLYIIPVTATGEQLDN